jgi:hypothetical protein
VSEPKPLPTYYPGDEIRMRLSFGHEANIMAVEVVYTHAEDLSYTLTLSGNPEPEPEKVTTRRYKASRADVSGVVDDAHRPGVYGARRVVFYTFSGQAFLRDALELANFPVLQICPELDSTGNVIVELEPEDD